MKTSQSVSGFAVSTLILGLTAWATLGADRVPAPDIKATPGNIPSRIEATSDTTAKPAVLAEANTNSTVALENSRSPSLSPAKVPLSFWADQILKLSEAGIDDGVQLSFIDNSAGTFGLGADQIIHLISQGVPSDIVSAMLQHDSELAAGLRSLPDSITPSMNMPLQIVLVPRSEVNPATNAAPAHAAPAPAEPFEDFTSDATSLASMESPPAPEPAIAPQPTAQQTETRRSFYAVRDPNPVTVTAPFVVIRASGGRVANLQLLEMFP